MNPIARKANRILHLFLLAMMLIFFRIFFLTTVQYEKHLLLSQKPKLRSHVQKAARGTIRDRFNHPLAINKIQYDASILYALIKEVPRITFEKGKKVYKRREHIEQLSEKLAILLDLDPLEIEDQIYAKASLFPTTPYVIKENVDEKTYYKLRMLEKDLLGIKMIRGSKRFYPKGKVAADIIGYIGTISQNEYVKVAEEISKLSAFLKSRENSIPTPLPKGYANVREIHLRLSELREKSYSMTDFVGKSGIEGRFNAKLRGHYGLEKFEVDTKGQFLRRLPESRDPISGHRFLLNISSELQEFAETLLKESELTRDKNFTRHGLNHHIVPPPWIKGGAICAVIPKTGEIVAMATYPTFDPNDFASPRNMDQIHKWFETPKYLERLWDGVYVLEKEGIETPLTWDTYLDKVLSPKGSLRKVIREIKDIKTGLKLLDWIDILLSISRQPKLATVIDTLYPEKTKTHFQTTDEESFAIIENFSDQIELLDTIKEKLDQFFTKIPHNDDKILLVDLIRLLINKDLFQEDLIATVGNNSLSDFRTISQISAKAHKQVRSITEDLYKKTVFLDWRKQHFKTYLKKRRLEEKEKKTWARPYTDYLEKIQSKMFLQFWNENRWSLLKAYLLFDSDGTIFTDLIATLGKNEGLDSPFQPLRSELSMLSSNLALSYLKTMRTFSDLTRPLFGRYRRKTQEKDLAKMFYPPSGYSYGRSYAYRQACPQGSLFKIVTAYEAIKQQKLKNLPLNPLTIIDERKGSILGYTLDGKPIKRKHKGGRMPSSYRSMGKVDLFSALQQSSNVYFSYLASDILESPNDLKNAALEFGYGRRTGIDLPGELRGKVPNDLLDNRTGLYSFAIGQHSFITTPLQTSLMYTAIANKGDVLKPQILNLSCGLDPSRHIFDHTKKYPYKKALNSVGITFPIFTNAWKGNITSHVSPQIKEKKNSLFMPDDIRHTLLEAMNRVIWDEKGSAYPYKIRALYENRSYMKDYLSLRNQVVGKTASAEFMYRPHIDRETPAIICKDTWFGGISFSDEHTKTWEEPELAIVVYLRYGDYGKETAPLAMQMIKKWRDIIKKESAKSYTETYSNRSLNTPEESTP